MKIFRVLAFAAAALFLGLALAGPAGAGPVRVDTDGVADDFVDDGGVGDPPPTTTTTFPPPPPRDPFDRPTAPGGDVLLDPRGDDSSDPADPDPADSDDGSTDPPSGGGSSGSGSTPDGGTSQATDGASSDTADPSADGTPDEEAAAEIDTVDDTDGGVPLALMAVLAVALAGVGGLVAMVRREA